MYKMLVIGFSAGGMPLVKRMLRALPKDYPLPIAIVTHLLSGQECLIAKLLDDIVQLPVSMAKDKEAILAGRIYIAPPDYHLLVEKKLVIRPCFALSVDNRVKLMRPSIDVLFESAAEAFESELIAVLLSGLNADGAEGMAYVKQLGGLSIVLDPHESEFISMPSAALELMTPDYVVNLDEIIHLLLSVSQST